MSSHIFVESTFGAATKKPFVKLIVDEKEVCLPLEQAKEIALWLLQAAESATMDAFLYEYTLSQGEDPVPVMRDFRTFRECLRVREMEVEDET